jgi:hypothetical protein
VKKDKKGKFMIYDIAGLRICIQNRCEYTTRFCQAYLSGDQDSPYDVFATVTNEEFYEEKRLSGDFSDGYIENICLYRAICRQLPTLDRMLLHAAILEYDGKGYAFLGRSGTGKSTHTGLWLEYLKGSKIVNGDKPILSCDENGFRAYGTPWMGKEGFGSNTSVPLCGLCFLEQAKVNEITRLTPSEAANRVFTQILLPEDVENVQKTLELTDKLVTNVPAYLLKCDISREAVMLSFEQLTGLSFEDREQPL